MFELYKDIIFFKNYEDSKDRLNVNRIGFIDFDKI